MDSSVYEADGNLRLVLASWVVALHALDVRCEDDDIAGICDALVKGEGEPVALVDAISERLGGTEVSDVESVARDLYGERVSTDLGDGDRAERVSRVRSYQFGRRLPWIARIIERHPSGAVGPSWLLVEQVTDVVRTMDYNPWNDIDEERAIPVSDFQVLWELDTCTSLSLR